MSAPDLVWMLAGDPFPPLSRAWGEDSDAPGLLAAGGELSVQSLVQAYERGIFPWFNPGQPILWWSPDPRMVLRVKDFRIHRSFKKTLQRFQVDAACEIRVNTNFAGVIQACAQMQRPTQRGTWIVPPMVDAYIAFHEAGHAHSFETWIDGKMVAGLYFVSVGHAVFGESMFTTVADGSKFALAALIAACRAAGVPQLDCQQVTAHLATLGACPLPRSQFLDSLRQAKVQAPVAWHFLPADWRHLET
ncbi:MAG: leucyl/phenylalanyl-tRNA--protein transferase [Betaproteobacteria bacterium]|jgi:leucyl/phenylalanyl-tRNA--protein transferase